ncbi:MAG: hypothetical protein ABI364_09290, partial [Caldimonas sp.]
ANFSRMLYTAGQPSRAAQMAERGLRISGSAGPATELDAILQGNRARALVELGRFDEAKALTEKALASALERKDTRWAGTFALYGGPAWCSTGDAARCESMLATAREKLTEALPAGHPTLGLVEVLAARVSIARGQPSAAREQLQRALAILDAAKDKPPQRVAARALLARLDAEAGDAANASANAAQAVAEARVVSRGFASTEWLGAALVAQAIVLRAGGVAAGATQALREGAAQLTGAVGADAPATREAEALLAGT